MELLAKDPASGGKGCPSVYIDDTGEFVVQGPALEAGAWAKVENPLPGETAVRISPEIVMAAVERHRQRQA